MNKNLINQFADQAGMVFEARWGDSDAAVITLADLEKFAKLVVKECANIADGADNGTTSEGDITAASIQAQIKKHFGVA